ncbi:hypothetical protein AAFF_G00055410 [Aldrovandia affinis]|uniref:Pyrin domain-containing protein n=1 Tax=Aldrovandia affinis TaxID=143900 RepID=A0AAD7R2H8_9TELE|nr:hypothetical protein AAFF_G00055410 [Aldrovandia affinis]
MENTVYDLILGALESLSADEFEKFKHTLSARREISFGLIENESKMAIARRIINKFREKHAIEHTAKVLRAIDLNNQAEDLEEAYARQGASSVAGMGAPEEEPRTPASHRRRFLKEPNLLVS